MPYADETNLQRIADDIKANIVNNLTTSSSTKFLSAAMGKSLNDGKVNKESGKGLSTNDFTTAEKTKLSGIETGADVTDAANVKSAGAVMSVSVNGTALTKDSNGKVSFNQLITFSGTALVNGTWSNGVLTLSLPDSGLLSTDVPFIDYYPYTGYKGINNFEAYCLVTYIEVGNASLKFHALGDVPTVPFGIQYKVVR